MTIQEVELQRQIEEDDEDFDFSGWDFGEELEQRDIRLWEEENN